MRSLRRQGGWLLHKLGGRRVINLVISVDQNSLYNAFTTAGSPAGPCDVVVTVNAGVILKAGFTMGAWALGSSMKLDNSAVGATICGTGGVGGFGDAVTSASTVTGAQNGFAGGPAIIMTGPLTIDNTGGQINGGGGGGGGGGMAASFGSGGWNGGNSACGGGGGGGQGYNNAAGGLGGVHFDVAGSGGLRDGDNGAAGSSGGGGTGGSGKNNLFGGATSGTGGAGGGWGTVGVTGQDGSSTIGIADAGQPGGAAGNAISKNGFLLTFPFAKGNNGTQVKGSIV